MKFSSPLQRGILQRRYKRFLADVTLDTGQSVTAHCPNSGSMMSVCEPGSEVWLSKSDNATRKHPYTWELIRTGAALVGINTQLPNRIVADAISAGAVAELAGYEDLRREVRMGVNSRVDIVLDSATRPSCLVEVKNVTLLRDPARPGYAEFPDAKTVRGSKHLRELGLAVGEGQRAVMFFLAQRRDAEQLGLAHDIDPDYGAAFREALAVGVEAVCYRCDVSTAGIEIAEAIPIFEN